MEGPGSGDFDSNGRGFGVMLWGAVVWVGGCGADKEQDMGKGLIVLCGLGALMGGCAAPGSVTSNRATNYHIRRLPSTAYAAAFQAAEAALREYDFRIDKMDRSAGVLVSRPSEKVIQGGTGKIGDEVLRSPNRVRRVAEIGIVREGDGVSARCKVLMERLDTGDYRAFRRERGGGDVPVETPIEEDGGTVGDQRETWTFVRRDLTLERQLLAAVAERVNGEAAGDSR